MGGSARSFHNFGNLSREYEDKYNLRLDGNQLPELNKITFREVLAGRNSAVDKSKQDKKNII
jgi:hypothetical protein